MDITIPRIIKNWRFSSNIEFTKNFEENKVSPGRRFARQNSNGYLWQRSFAEFGLYPDKEEPILGSLLMNHFKDKACTHLHKDSAPEGYVHIRANVMLKKPQKGGNIIIDEKIYNVEKNDLWLILASLEDHGSTPIENGERLIYSFGAIIEKDKINKILKEKKNEFKS